MTSGKAYSVALDWFTRGGAVLVPSVGFAVISGWLFNVPLLKSVMPGLTTMRLFSACAFVAAGVALWLRHTSRPGSHSLRIGRALSFIVLAVGSLTLAEYVFAMDFGIDQLIPDTVQAANVLPPGRMAPATALSFFMVGTALFTLKAHNPRFASWPHWLVVPPLFISALAIVGYAYGDSSLYEVWAYSSMAAHTALAFFILTLSILAVDLAHGFARIATSDTAGGVVSRRLLPTIPLILFRILLGAPRGTGGRTVRYSVRHCFDGADEYHGLHDRSRIDRHYPRQDRRSPASAPKARSRISMQASERRVQNYLPKCLRN